MKQNRAYNHMTEYELVGMSERLDPQKVYLGLLEMWLSTFL